jgi:hypothetical protein
VVEGVVGHETGISDPMAWLDEDVESARRALEEIVAYHATTWPLEAGDPNLDTDDGGS